MQQVKVKLKFDAVAVKEALIMAAAAGLIIDHRCAHEPSPDARRIPPGDNLNIHQSRLKGVL